MILSFKVLVKAKAKQCRTKVKQQLLWSLKRRNCVWFLGGGEIMGKKILGEKIRDFSERMRKHKIIGDDMVVCESKRRLK